jgi:competence protein ComEC
MAVVQRLSSLPELIISIFLLTAALTVTWIRPFFAVPCALIVGIAYAMLAGNLALDSRLAPEKSGYSGELLIEVIGLPQFDRDQWHFQATVKSAEGLPELQGERIKLTWYRTNERLFPGDVWHLDAKLRIPNGVQNPGGFDAEQRALEQGIVAQGYVKGNTRLVSVEPSIDRWRDRLSRHMAASLGQDKARFVQALALGDTRSLSDADWTLLRQTGITHLIAISGFHVGIVALFAAWLVAALYFIRPTLGLIMARPLAIAWISIAAAIAYTAMAGFAIATVRTAWMIGLLMAARICHRQAGVIQVVALSMVLMLLWDPFCLLSPGFWLSFVGVLLLAVLMPNGAKAPLLSEFLRAQWLVSLGLLPLTVAFFGETTVIGPLVNLIAIPLISLVIVPLALLGCLFVALPVVGIGLWNSSAWLMEMFWKGLIWISQTPWSSIYLPEPSIWLVLLALCGAVLSVLPKPFPGRAMGIVLIIPLFVPQLPEVNNGQVRVAMMDVGQGLSVLVQTTEHNMLYDTGAGIAGGFSRGQSTVVPALRARGIQALDKVVISHEDNDHAGGFEAVRAALEIRRTDSPEPMALPNAGSCRAGQAWNWDGVDFEYIWPIEPLSDSDNDRSCVLLVKTRTQRLLLTGDISQAVERELVVRYPELRVDILLAPHHGSKTSSSAEFLTRLNPDLVLISSGFQNRFRHPHPSVVERYRGLAIDHAGTVEFGWTELLLTADAWQWWRRERLNDRRYWMRSAESVQGTRLSD